MGQPDTNIRLGEVEQIENAKHWHKRHLYRYHQHCDHAQKDPVAAWEAYPGESIGCQRPYQHRQDCCRYGNQEAVQKALAHALSTKHLGVVLDREVPGAKGCPPAGRGYVRTLPE